MIQQHEHRLLQTTVNRYDDLSTNRGARSRLRSLRQPERRASHQNEREADENPVQKHKFDTQIGCFPIARLYKAAKKFPSIRWIRDSWQKFGVRTTALCRTASGAGAFACGALRTAASARTGFAARSWRCL